MNEKLANDDDGSNRDHRESVSDQGECIPRGRPHPDPALLQPPLPGMRPHRHVPDQLHPWVFRQGEVWVDYYGNEHEIGCLGLEYAHAIVGFCRGQALRIRLLVDPDFAPEALRAALAGVRAGVIDEPPVTPELGAAAREWLETTELLIALRRRIEDLEQGEPASDEEQREEKA